jgi:hypothetical protein
MTDTPYVEAEAENILAQTLMELQQISAHIQQEQIEIDRLKAESHIITAHTDLVLSRLRVQLNALAGAG